MGEAPPGGHARTTRPTSRVNGGRSDGAGHRRGAAAGALCEALARFARAATTRLQGRLIRGGASHI
eukprot:223989-Prymnesium_polylepis.1